MISAKIVDGLGSRFSAHVTTEHALLVTHTPYPAYESLSYRIIPFRQFFTGDGTATGSNDMRVDGSSTAIDFWVPASASSDRFISTISIAISDSSATPAKFGALTALTNGVQLFYDSVDHGNIYLHDSLKTNFDFIRFGLGTPPIGSSNDGFRLSNVIGNADTYAPFIDLAKLVPPNGVRLVKGTAQKLIFRIRDNISTIDGFDAIAFGYDLLEQ